MLHDNVDCEDCDLPTEEKASVGLRRKHRNQDMLII